MYYCFRKRSSKKDAFFHSVSQVTKNLENSQGKKSKVSRNKWWRYIPHFLAQDNTGFEASTGISIQKIPEGNCPAERNIWK